MKKECTYAFFPTDEESNILKVTTDKMEYRDRRKGDMELHDSPWQKSEEFEPQHLYIISDDKIKEGDSFIDTNNKVSKCKERDLGLTMSGWRKIIATTNRKVFALMKNRFPATISQSDIEYIISLYNGKGKEVDVEYLAKDYLFNDYEKKFVVDTNDIQLGVIKGFIEGYNRHFKDNADKKFTLEDMRNAFDAGEEYSERMNSQMFATDFNGFIESITKKETRKNAIMVWYDDAVAFEGGEVNPNFMKPKLDTLGNIIICK